MGGGQRRQTQTGGLQAGTQCTAAGGGKHTHASENPVGWLQKHNLVKETAKTLPHCKAHTFLSIEANWCNVTGVCQQTRLTRSPVKGGNSRGETLYSDRLQWI